MLPNPTAAPAAIKIKVRGPFWEAEVLFVEGGIPGSDTGKVPHLRNLFVQANRPPGATTQVFRHRPGTVLALVAPQRVEVRPGNFPTYAWTAAAAPPRLDTEEQIVAALQAGQAALLLLQADPLKDPGKAAEWTCVAGEIAINLEVGAAGAGQTDSSLWMMCGLTAVTDCRAHASGISIHGTAAVPWDTAAISDRAAAPAGASGLAGWYMLSVDLPHTKVDTFRLTPELDRMSAGEIEGFRSAWTLLSRVINPRHPRNGASGAGVPAPTWVTFELTDPTAAPGLYWTLGGSQGKPALHLRPGEVAILLADQSPYGATGSARPASLAQVVPEVEIQWTDTGITVKATAGLQTAPADTASLSYAWQRRAGAAPADAPAERFDCSNLLLGFDPIETASLVRGVLNLPPPALAPAGSGGPRLDPPLVWGFMPLEDGWAQLPVPNLTEQVYISLKQEEEAAPGAKPASAASILQGAVSFGNDDPVVLDGFPGEQPWNLVLVAAQGLYGTWTLKREGGDTRLDAVTLTIFAPLLYLNGLLWLATAAPTLEDALPDLSGWTNALAPVSLRSVGGMPQAYPALVQLRLDKLGLQLRPVIPDQPLVPHASAGLDGVTMTFGVDSDLLGKLTSAKSGAAIMPRDLFARRLPLIWRRHPSLPMIQALPLTQNRHTANYPSASRQLIPFALPAGGDPPGPTDEWRFELAGAYAWPRLAGKAIVSAEWLAAGKYDLPVAALSLPGLELNPDAGANGSGLTAGTQPPLPAQYRFDLPYLDQVHALSQLPRPANRTEGESEPPPEPLTRETLVDYWQALAERAALARASAVEALGPGEVRNLVEPFAWPVDVALDDASFPGALKLTDMAENGGPSLELRAEAALRGLEGAFAESGGKLRLLEGDGDAAYHLVAGSMAARPDGMGRYRDQRGLFRGPSAETGALIRTPVELQDPEKPPAVELTSLLAPLTLHALGKEWGGFWFRDLPMKSAAFVRQDTLSREAVLKQTDVNDPDALSRRVNYLAGYQWGLSPLGGAAAPLSLGGLDFYPLSLETVTLKGDEGDEVDTLSLVGRLQFPLPGKAELPDLGNAVLLTFKAGGGTLSLDAIGLADKDGQAEWPLEVKDGELTDAPVIRWTALALDNAKAALTIADPVLHFVLFDAPWALKLDPLTFPLPATISAAQPAPLPNVPAGPLEPTHLLLDLAGSRCELTLHASLGRRRAADGAAPGSGANAKSPAAFETGIVFPLVGDRQPRWGEPSLFSDLAPVSTAQTAIYANHTLRFCWNQCSAGAGQPELLPGMLLPQSPEGRIDAPGLAVLSFAVTPGVAIPAFTLQMGYLEVLFHACWGKYLGDPDPKRARLRDDTEAFGPSAGDVSFAYTTTYGGAATDQWDETFLLNGFVEIKNLVSWPYPGRDGAKKRTLELPATTAGADLGHLRHVIRVLFDQHTIPPDLPVTGRGHLLFELGNRPWQFAAMVEHQLAHIAMEGGKPALQNAQRWTAMQEVRICTPRQLGAAIGLAADFTIHRLDQLPLPATLQDENQVTEVVQGKTVYYVTPDPFQNMGTAWLGNFHPQGKQPPLQATCYRVIRFQVKGVPKGARIQSAWLKVAPSTSPIDVPAVSLTYFVEKSVNRAEISKKRPVEPGSLHTRPEFGNVTVSTDPWRAKNPSSRLVDLVDLAPLLQDLIDGIDGLDWNPDSSIVTVVIQGVADAKFVQDHKIGPYNNPAFHAGQPTLELNAMPALLDMPLVGGLFSPDLRPILSEGLKRLEAQHTLFVEASAPLWLRDKPLGASGADTPALTALQFLPTGVQMAELSNPQDFAAPTQQDWKWQMLVMPFLGRLQGEGGLAAPPSPLEQDPVWLLRDGKVDPGQRRLALILANRGDKEPVVFDASGFEALAARTIERLDRSTLEENWLRLQLLTQHVLGSEGASGSPQSILAGQPNTPARLGSELALRRLLDANRPCYPPQPADGGALPPDVAGQQLIWREASLLLLDGLVEPQAGRDADRVYAWRVSTLPLRELAGRLKEPDQVTRYPAVTILPAWAAGQSVLPLGFAVSPYLSLDHKRRDAAPALAQSQGANPALRVAELLALRPGDGRLRPVASLTVDAEGNAAEAEERDLAPAPPPDPIVEWAIEAARRLAPQSPLIVLRRRTIDRDTAGWPVTNYAYQVLDGPAAGQALARRTGSLRAPADRLRFRQGQFSPDPMPAGLQPFEVAPPQTTGLQPVYITPQDGQNGGDCADWPWGLSALRAAIRYTKDEEGVVALPVQERDAKGDTAGALWWQSVQTGVQYREASGDDRPAASLPSLFRSRAIAALLPVNPAAPLPHLAALEGWQPVLPGRLRYLLTGSRPGVPLAFRHMLLRQDLATPERPLVSGSVPVQHRSPRPVPLPANRAERLDVALQTWGSYFEPNATGLFSSDPLDETFTAAAGPAGARRVRVRLLSPRHGLLDAEWRGKVTFEITGLPASPHEWQPVVALVGNGVKLEMEPEKPDGPAVQPVDLRTYTVKDRDGLRDSLARIERLTVQPDAGGSESVSLPLTYAPARFRLPLAPVFARFEDPEYNRRLGSPSASVVQGFTAQEKDAGKTGPHQLQLSADRRAYHPLGEVAFRYDWENPGVIQKPDATDVTLTRIAPNGLRALLLRMAEPAPQNATLCRWSLPGLAAKEGVQLKAGDRLELTVSFGPEKESEQVSLVFDVVEDPVSPAPEAGYALLRKQEGAAAVEVARFAWNPEPARVELVCPDDLVTGFVRRRAIFQWQDTVRAGQAFEYAIQKITEGGSTHWPAFAKVIDG